MKVMLLVIGRVPGIRSIAVITGKGVDHRNTSPFLFLFQKG